jgi:Tfp pilus assembly protein FimT
MHAGGGWRGFSIAELLVVVGLFAIALGMGMWSWLRSPSAASVARELASVVSASRWTAVHLGAPRLLAADGTGQDLHVTQGGYGCAGATEGPVVWSAPARSVVGWPAMGIAFAPDGRPRRCDGSAVGNTTILIEGPRGDRAAVIVASLGRVRWERR